MKFRYVGAESLPGSGETTAFGMTIRVGEVFECPPDCVRKAKLNPFFEPVSEDRSGAAPDAQEDAHPVTSPRRGRPPKSAS
jgi:hypothetical protein